MQDYVTVLFVFLNSVMCQVEDNTMCMGAIHSFQWCQSKKLNVILHHNSWFYDNYFNYNTRRSPQRKIRSGFWIPTSDLDDLQKFSMHFLVQRHICHTIFMNPISLSRDMSQLCKMPYITMLKNPLKNSGIRTQIDFQNLTSSCSSTDASVVEFS